jgi:glycosyltransferase involved in cell wall biosynthesis
MCSIMARKNPLGLIRAYRRAFRADDRVGLAIKVSRGSFDPAGLAGLNEAAADAGVTVIDRVMSRQESYALLDCCDCYASLHRSEGFGLTLAEAMLLGKPVLATGYSGNLDFMTPANSLLVGYERVPIREDLPFYRRGAVWAEPSVGQAAEAMRWAYEHPAEARALGGRAREEARRVLSLDAAGRRMAERLRAIRAGRRGDAGCSAA